MPRRYGKTSMRFRREIREMIRAFSKHGMVFREVRHIILDLGFPREEAARLLAEADERAERQGQPSATTPRFDPASSLLPMASLTTTMTQEEVVALMRTGPQGSTELPED